MKNTDEEFVIVGKIGATYGVQGWLKVNSFTDPVSNILAYFPWHTKNKQLWQPIHVEAAKEHGTIVIAKFAGITTPESARLLTGTDIAILRQQLPALKNNEYYWRDLEGLAVINQRGEWLGKVTHLMETGSNDVLVIKGLKEHAIPFLIPDVITRIDLEKGEIYVEWELV